MDDSAVTLKLNTLEELIENHQLFYPCCYEPVKGSEKKSIFVTSIVLCVCSAFCSVPFFYSIWMGFNPVILFLTSFVIVVFPVSTVGMWLVGRFKIRSTLRMTVFAVLSVFVGVTVVFVIWMALLLSASLALPEKYTFYDGFYFASTSGSITVAVYDAIKLGFAFYVTHFLFCAVFVAYSVANRTRWFFSEVTNCWLRPFRATRSFPIVNGRSPGEMSLNMLLDTPESVKNNTIFCRIFLYLDFRPDGTHYLGISYSPSFLENPSAWKLSGKIFKLSAADIVKASKKFGSFRRMRARSLCHFMFNWHFLFNPKSLFEKKGENGREYC